MRKNAKKVFIAFHDVDHEGTISFTVHKTLEGANAEAKSKWEASFKDGVSGGYTQSSRIEEDGSFHGYMNDSEYKVVITPLRR